MRLLEPLHMLAAKVAILVVTGAIYVGVAAESSWLPDCNMFGDTDCPTEERYCAV